MTINFNKLNIFLANELGIQKSQIISKYFEDETDPRICVKIMKNLWNIDTNILNKYNYDLLERTENSFTFLLNTGNPEFHYEFKKSGIIY